MTVVGPGVIVLGVSIGSGEFLLGPAAFVRHGLTLLWVTGVAVFLQTIFNTELMRYTLATGEPVFTGFMRTRPSSTLWAWVYAILYFLQVGWPAWAANAAGAIFFLVRAATRGTGRRRHGLLDRRRRRFSSCVAILLGRATHRADARDAQLGAGHGILGSFLLLALMLRPGRDVGRRGGRVRRVRCGRAALRFPAGRRGLLPARRARRRIRAPAASANITLSNWARDKGYGMGERAGYIPAAVGGKKVNLAHTGFMFAPDDEAMQRWRGWWRIVRADQWGVFFVGAILGMVLPALLYVTFLPRGHRHPRPRHRRRAGVRASAREAGPLLAA